jgi:hypothetical protein
VLKEAKINFARTCVEELGPAYRRNKKELNRAERALYEAALRVGLKALMTPGEARTVWEAHIQDTDQARARAEAARKAKNPTEIQPELKAS